MQEKQTSNWISNAWRMQWGVDQQTFVGNVKASTKTSPPTSCVGVVTKVCYQFFRHPKIGHYRLVPDLITLN